MTLTGWTLPQTPSGRASTLPPPPWHYSGDIIAVDFTADPAVVSELVPPGFEAAGDGSASFVFCDWCSSADLDPRIAGDPSWGQYKEAYVVLHGRYDGKRAGRVPYIWVDNDLSLVRGLIQGFPKKLGDIAMSRPVTIGNGGAKREAGSRFSAWVSALGQRLCSLSVTLDAEREGVYPKGVAAPLVHTRLFPRIGDDQPAVHELSRGTITDFQVANLFSGPATLTFGDSEHEELAALSPIEVGEGWVGELAFSVTGGTVIPLDGPGS